MNTHVIHQVLARTQAGDLTFSEVARRLLEIGVESYFVDLATAHETLYMSNCTTHREPLTVPLVPIAREFSLSGILAAIHSAQADTIRYPEFLKQAADSGVIAYWAFLTGEKIIYFGREGETHTEEFTRPVV